MEAKLIIKLQIKGQDVELTHAETEELYQALERVLPPMPADLRPG